MGCRSPPSTAGSPGEAEESEPSAWGTITHTSVQPQRASPRQACGAPRPVRATQRRQQREPPDQGPTRSRKPTPLAPSPHSQVTGQPPVLQRWEGQQHPLEYRAALCPAAQKGTG